MDDVGESRPVGFSTDILNLRLLVNACVKRAASERKWFWANKANFLSKVMRCSQPVLRQVPEAIFIWVITAYGFSDSHIASSRLCVAVHIFRTRGLLLDASHSSTHPKTLNKIDVQLPNEADHLADRSILAIPPAIRRCVHGPCRRQRPAVTANTF